MESLPHVAAACAGARAGRIHDVNVLGMDWMERYELSLHVDFSVSCLKLI